MSYFDIIFVIAILWSAMRGWSTGFVIQLSSLVAMIIGAFVAYKTSYWVAEKFLSMINADPIIMNTIAFIITFVVVWGLVIMLGKFLNIVVKVALLGIVNRIFGVVFAVAKTVFILSIMLMLIGNLDKALNFLPKEQTEKSLLYKPIESFAPSVFPYLKNGFNDLQKLWEDHKEKLNEVNI